MDEIQKALELRYPHLHPLMFSRSIEYATTNGELFDILETVPKEMPVTWNHKQRRWVVVNLLQRKKKKK